MILNRQTMTSLEIAELTGKRHDNIVRDIDTLLKQGLDVLNFEETSYVDKSNRQQRCYELTKKGCLILASGYDALLREKIIDRWEYLETNSKHHLPSNYLEALKALVVAEEQKRKLADENKAKSGEIIALSDAITEMQPKVSYVDMVLQCKETVTTTQIAQDYGMSAKAFNVLLRNFDIQHKVGGQWILYAKYLQQGYVQSDTIGITHTNGTKGVVMHTKWTQKGRLFIYEELKKKEVLPLIEK